ncbi:MAG: T9SS type A sorting domain-containing protein [Saprospiraceae bacterium]
MKLKTTFTFLIFAFFLFQNLFSQSFVDEGNQWSLVTYSFNGDASNQTFKIEGDTIINGVNYKKMLKADGNPILANWNFSSFMRQDSSKKVFTSDHLGNETLIYDFGLAVGDTIVSNQSPDILTIVQAIDSIELNDGSKRKRLDLGSLSCPIDLEDEFWIDGIGGIYHVFTSLENLCAFDARVNLHCFSNNGISLFGLVDGDNCFIINSTNEIAESVIKIFPNPTQDILNLEYDETIKIEHLKFYDFQGQLIRSLQVENHFSQISISEFPEGVYYLKIETAKSKFIFKKFIKM